MRLSLPLFLFIGFTGAINLDAQVHPRTLQGSIPADFIADASMNRSKNAPAFMPMFLPVEESVGPVKSVALATGLSALLPGTGQLYAEAPLWRTILYAGLEVAGWTAYGLTSSKGNELSDEFQLYADQHWSVVRYIEWLGANYERWSDSAVNKPVAADALQRVLRPADPSRPEWERVDFEQLNRLEKAIRAGFSHTLPVHGHQQYYEQIGKYAQYRAGWDDHAGRTDTVIYDPSKVTERNLAYMDTRAEANAYLGYASAALGGIIINHIVSLLDAMLEARAYNASIRAQLKGSIAPGSLEPLHASVQLSVHF